jgi:hypothetical protein
MFGFQDLVFDLMIGLLMKKEYTKLKEHIKLNRNLWYDKCKVSMENKKLFSPMNSN